MYSVLGCMGANEALPHFAPHTIVHTTIIRTIIQMIVAPSSNKPCKRVGSQTGKTIYSGLGFML